MDGKERKISVIMPTHQRGHLIEKSIQSVLAQTFVDFELIIINDGSKDQTIQICNEYVEKDDRIKFITYEDNRGAGYARNKGIEVSVGEYITFVDDDDIVYPNMLKFLLELINRYEADISICGCYYEFDGVMSPKYIFDELLVLDKVGGLEELLKREKYNSSNSNKLFHNKLFENVCYKENTKVDDIHLIYKLFAKANVVVVKGTPLYICVRHNDNNSAPLQQNIWTPELLREYIGMQKARVRYLSQNVPEISARVRYSEWSFYISMCDKIKKTNNYNCKKEYGEMIDMLKENEVEFLQSEFITKTERELMKKYVISD